MTDESIGDHARQLEKIADAVPVQTAGHLCEQVEAVRDQLAEIAGFDSQVVGQAQHLVTATTEVIGALAAVRTKVAGISEHHQGGRASTPTTGGAPIHPQTAPTAPTSAKPEQALPKTVADEEGGLRTFPSSSAAKRALGRRPGHELHHIVEQAQTKDHRSGFSPERVNTTDNMIWLPVGVHRRITARYARKLRGSGHTLRDVMNGMSWDEQYSRGMRAIRHALREAYEDDE